jgi:DNA-binding IclR family transcriptional regulator
VTGPRDMFSAMASGSALVVVGVLVEGPGTVTEIAGEANLSATRTHALLAGLREAGVVSSQPQISRDDGRPGRPAQIYRLEPDALAYVARWLAVMAKHARQQP